MLPITAGDSSGPVRAACANKSDHYLTFGIGISWVFIWRTYYVEIGVRGGVVDFLFADIRTDCPCP